MLELIFVFNIRKKVGSKIKLNEWETFLDWEIEASRRSTDKFSILQEVSKKFRNSL